MPTECSKAMLLSAHRRLQSYFAINKRNTMELLLLSVCFNPFSWRLGPGKTDKSIVDPAASLVGNVDPQQPEIGMSVQISRRFRLNRMAGRVMTATPHIVADTTVCVPLANDEPFNEECFTRTIGWLASKDTKTEADLITLLSMDHKVYGTVTEVSLDTDGGQHATVQWWATMRCSHV